MMNMTMNGTDEMANDTIAEAPEEMPSSDDGRRKLLQLEGLQDSVTGVVDKVNDYIGTAAGNLTAMANGTEGNMTMNGTDEMASDSIAEAPEEGEEMPEEGEEMP